MKRAQLPVAAALLLASQSATGQAIDPDPPPPAAPAPEDSDPPAPESPAPVDPTPTQPEPTPPAPLEAEPELPSPAASEPPVAAAPATATVAPTAPGGAGLPPAPATTTLSTPRDLDALSAMTHKPKRQFGAMLDLGLPDGIMLSFVYRPLRELRVTAGLGYNAVSPGVRLEAMALPLGELLSLGLGYGHYFEGDANGLVASMSGNDESQTVLLERFGYDYVTLRAGLELGGDRFLFFTRAGLSWIRTEIHDFDEAIDPETQVNGNTSISVPQDPVLSAWAPSLNFGMIVRL